MSEPFALTVPPGRHGRVDAVLAALLDASRGQVQAAIKAGLVRVDGELVSKGRQKVGPGCVVTGTLPGQPTTDLVAEDLDIEVLYQDDDLVVVNKQAGMVVHPARGHTTGTLVHGLLHLLTPAQTVRGHPVPPERPGVVHRLDKGTSGVMVVARTPAAHASLAEQFAAHSADRRYLALVWGRMPDTRGTVDAPVGRHPSDRLRFAVRDNGKHAVTHWTCLAEGHYGVAGNAAGGTVSLLRCHLETGRTHQIRVHLAHLGRPVLGDPLYGPKKPRGTGALRRALEPLDHQLLHATRLGITHPRTGARLDWRTPPPDNFRAALEAVNLGEPIDAFVAGC